MTHLTNEESHILLESNHLGKLTDIRISNNGAELLGKEVVAVYWNGGLNGHSFVVKDLENDEFGEVDDEAMYTMTWAYLVVHKVSFDEWVEEFRLNEFKAQVRQLRDSFTSLVNAWNNLSPEQSDRINEFGNYPFQFSLDEHRIDSWVDTIDKLDN